MTRVVFTWLMLPVLGVLAYADDWPSWRGPAGTGVTSETGLPRTVDRIAPASRGVSSCPAPVSRRRSVPARTSM